MAGGVKRTASSWEAAFNNGPAVDASVDVSGGAGSMAAWGDRPIWFHVRRVLGMYDRQNHPAHSVAGCCRFARPRVLEGL